MLGSEQFDPSWFQRSFSTIPSFWDLNPPPFGGWRRKMPENWPSPFGFLNRSSDLERANLLANPKCGSAAVESFTSAHQRRRSSISFQSRYSARGGSTQPVYWLLLWLQFNAAAIFETILLSFFFFVCLFVCLFNEIWLITWPTSWKFDLDCLIRLGLC